MLRNDQRHRSWLPHGFEFLDPGDTKRLNTYKESLRRIFAQHRFQEIVPPAIDFAHTFALTTRDSVRKTGFELRGSGGEYLAVRPDLTVQVIKAAANGRLGESRAGNFAYIQPVFHDHGWGAGQRREVLQAGVEQIGSDRKTRIAELLGLARAALTEITGEPPRILYGDVRVIDALLSPLPDSIRSRVSVALYNKDTARIAALCKEANVDSSLKKVLASVPLLFGGAEALEELRQLCQSIPAVLPLLDDAATHDDVIYDFSLVRELSYYTGPVFEGYLPGLTEKILSGGVYDELYAEFSDRAQPASGFAIHLSGLLDLPVDTKEFL